MPSKDDAEKSRLRTENTGLHTALGFLIPLFFVFFIILLAAVSKGH